MRNLIFILYLLLSINFYSQELKFVQGNYNYELITEKIKIQQLNSNVDILKLVKKENNKVISEFQFYDISKNYTGKLLILSQLTKPTKIEIKDMNNDGKNEIVIIGLFITGIYKTDAVESYDIEVWLDETKNGFIEIINKKIKGTLFYGSEEHEFKYEMTSLNKNNFIDMIKCYHKIINVAISMQEDGPINPIEKIYKETYLWNGEKYIHKISMQSTVDKLRLRTEPSLNGKFINYINKNDIVEVLELGGIDKIDNNYAYWVKVKTKDNEIGWAFDLFLESIF